MLCDEAENEQGILPYSPSIHCLGLCLRAPLFCAYKTKKDGLDKTSVQCSSDVHSILY